MGTVRRALATKPLPMEFETTAGNNQSSETQSGPLILVAPFVSSIAVLVLSSVADAGRWIMAATKSEPSSDHPTCAGESATDAAAAWPLCMVSPSRGCAL